MQGMLLCLKREIRLVFILGNIFEVTSTEGSQILDITPEAFRQRLSRGRKQIREFMFRKCSLVNPANPCYCEKQVAHDIKIRLINPKNLFFTNHPCHARQNDAAVDAVGSHDHPASRRARRRSPDRNERNQDTGLLAEYLPEVSRPGNLQNSISSI